MKLWLFVGLTFAIGCGKPSEPGQSTPSPSAGEPAPVAGAATITGKVAYRGDAPNLSPLKLAADPYCDSMHSGKVVTEDLLVNADGTLRNVFVYVKTGITGSYPPPTMPVVLDQTGCLYRPRVQGLQTGQVLIIRNSDDTLHNVHALGDQNPAFNLGQPMRGMESKKVFTKSEVMLRFKCDVHPWMTAYLGVVSHPFHATTGENGAFTLKNLPAGKFTLEAVHEKLGTKAVEVTLAEGEAKTLEFVFP
jgi:hypothetical protein